MKTGYYLYYCLENEEPDITGVTVPARSPAHLPLLLQQAVLLHPIL